LLISSYYILLQYMYFNVVPLNQKKTRTPIAHRFSTSHIEKRKLQRYHVINIINQVKHCLKIRAVRILNKYYKCKITTDMVSQSTHNSPRYCNFIGKWNSTLKIWNWWNVILFLINKFNYLKQNLTQWCLQCCTTGISILQRSLYT